MKTEMYEIFCSQGQGTTHGPKFHKLADALRHVSEYGGPGSLAIRCPDGGWYRWDDEKATIKNQRRHPRITVFHAGELKPECIDVVVRTVSNEGMCVILPSTQSVCEGAKLKLCLEISDVTVELPVEVVWFRGSRVGLHLESNALWPADRHRWESWIASQS